MLNLTSTTLAAVVNQARQDAADHPRWLNAITRAAKELSENPYMELQGDHLLVGSPSGTTYAANSVSQCEAFRHHRPCWHRSATQLMRRYAERADQASAARLHQRLCAARGRRIDEDKSYV